MDGLIHPSLFFYFFIGQIDACEFFFCSFPYVFAEVTDFIRMVFPCHLAVGFFYLVIAGIGGGCPELCRQYLYPRNTWI